MNSDTYLVQRLKRKNVNGPLSEYRFGEVFDLDYMGSAEFEFGAFPEFLRRMNKSLLGKFSATINGTKVFGVYDMSSFDSEAEVVATLQGIADRKIHLKEYSDFPPTATYTKTSAWAAIDSGIFWSIENISDGVKTLFANSVAYMDSRE